MAEMGRHCLEELLVAAERKKREEVGTIQERQEAKYCRGQSPMSAVDPLRKRRNNKNNNNNFLTLTVSMRNSVTYKFFLATFAIFCYFIFLLFHLMALFLCLSWFFSLIFKIKVILLIKNKNIIF